MAALILITQPKLTTEKKYMAALKICDVNALKHRKYNRKVCENRNGNKKLNSVA
jgi:hypothetical protein